MKRLIFAVFVAIFLAPTIAYSNQDEIKIWEEFVSLVKSNKLSIEYIRPPVPYTKESAYQGLESFRKSVVWEGYEIRDIVRYEDLLTFIVALKNTDGVASEYSFNFHVENGKWYFRHLEGIFIRLDKIGPPPISDFPDFPEGLKAYMRQELYWGKMIWLYDMIKQDKGHEQAIGIFLDGGGYFLAAQAWVPFYPPHRAFILYLCWEQSNMQHNPVTLIKLEDNEAIVRFDRMIFFEIYSKSGHMKQQISIEDYIEIFESIWQDRAKNAGWDLETKGKGQQITFHFTR